METAVAIKFPVPRKNLPTMTRDSAPSTKILFPFSRKGAMIKLFSVQFDVNVNILPA
jgi:hypothetical protein